EPVWLNVLIRRSYPCGDAALRVLKSDALHVGIHHLTNERQCFSCLLRSPRAALVPMQAAGTEIGAVRENDEQVPSPEQRLAACSYVHCVRELVQISLERPAHVALKMVAGAPFCRQNVARPRVVTCLYERVPDRG